MTIQETFPLEDMNLLRSRALDAWSEQITDEPPNGWSISPLDLRPFIAVFAPLTIKPGFVLRAYQFRFHRDGETMVWALPETAVFPPPDPESEDEPPQPPNALDDAMTAIQGDESPWSYLCASLLTREISEIGTFGHGSEWVAYHILDKNPLGTSFTKSPNAGPTGTMADWQWTASKPESWLPSVSVGTNQITVTFYTYCGLDTQELVCHVDTYKPGSYVSEQQEQVIASGPQGYRW